MELRYVYRKVEDDIGFRIHKPETPHSFLTRRLRFDLRELKDVAHRSELLATCMSSLAGNGSLDVIKVNDKVMDILSDAFSTKLPYVKQKDKPAESDDQDVIDGYFKELEEFSEKLRRQNDAIKGDSVDKI